MTIDISDAALNDASGKMQREVELGSTAALEDARIGALMTAVNAERIAGFPSGRLFLDSIEQALAAALVESHAVERRSVAVYSGGLTPVRLRRVIDLVEAKIGFDLTLEEMAESVDLSRTHFIQMFRRSTGQSPTNFYCCRGSGVPRKCCVRPRSASWT